MVRFGLQILRPIVVLRVCRNGKEVEFRGLVGQLLAILAENADREMEKARLKRRLWGTADVDDARLHALRSKLVAALDEVGAGQLVETKPLVGYRFNATGVALDLKEFDAEVTAAEKHLDDDEFKLAANHARHATDMWRDPPIDIPLARSQLRRAFVIQFQCSRALTDRASETTLWEIARDCLSDDDLGELRKDVAKMRRRPRTRRPKGQAAEDG